MLHKWDLKDSEIGSEVLLNDFYALLDVLTILRWFRFDMDSSVSFRSVQLFDTTIRSCKKVFSMISMYTFRWILMLSLYFQHIPITFRHCNPAMFENDFACRGAFKQLETENFQNTSNKLRNHYESILLWFLFIISSLSVFRYSLDDMQVNIQ